MSPFKFSPLRFFVTVAVLVPLYLVVVAPWHWSFWSQFLVTLPLLVVARGAAGGVEAVVGRTKKRTEVPVAKATPTDRQWELKMLLKKAHTAESREHWDMATALFEQAVERADEQEDLDLAVRHIEDIRIKRSARGGV